MEYTHPRQHIKCPCFTLDPFCLYKFRSCSSSIVNFIFFSITLPFRPLFFLCCSLRWPCRCRKPTLNRCKFSRCQQVLCRGRWSEIWVTLLVMWRPLANIVTLRCFDQSQAYFFFASFLFFGYVLEIFPPRGLKYTILVPVPQWMKD